MRHIPIAAAGTVLIFGLAGCSSNNNASAQANECGPVTVRVAHQNNTESTTHVGVERFAEILEKESEGRLSVDVFPGGQMGDSKDEIEQVRSGTLQVSIASPATLSTSYPNAAALAIPYGFPGDSEKEQWESLTKVQDGDALTSLTKGMAEETGLHALDWAWVSGFRHITNSVKPIESIDDVKGLYLRSPDAPVHMLPLQNMGASVTPIPFSELYLALQTGTVDGQENPVSLIVVSKFAEVQKHLALTSHLLQLQTPVTSTQFMESLCESDRELISEAMREAGRHQSEVAIQQNIDGVAKLEQMGMKVTRPKLDPFREANKTIAQEVAAETPGFDLAVYEGIRGEIEATIKK